MEALVEKYSTYKSEKGMMYKNYGIISTYSTIENMSKLFTLQDILILMEVDFIRIPKDPIDLNLLKEKFNSYFENIQRTHEFHQNLLNDKLETLLNHLETLKDDIIEKKDVKQPMKKYMKSECLNGQSKETCLKTINNLKQELENVKSNIASNKSKWTNICSSNTMDDLLKQCGCFGLLGTIIDFIYLYVDKPIMKCKSESFYIITAIKLYILVQNGTISNPNILMEFW